MADPIRPFRVNVPDEALIDLRRRIGATRWPERETVTDESQGVQLATIQELAEGTVLFPDTFKTYAQQVPRTLAPFGGRFLVGGGKIESLEGDPPKFSVIIAFDSVEKANAWWNSPAYEAIKPIRHAFAKASLFIVEGVPAD